MSDKTLLPCRYTKNPLTIEAMQFSGRWEDAHEIIAFTGGQAKEVSDLDYKRQYLVIDTLEGRMNIAPKDWVIKGVKGEFYPCKPDVFAASYHPTPSNPPVTADEAREAMAAFENYADDQTSFDKGCVLLRHQETIRRCISHFIPDQGEK